MSTAYQYDVSGYYVGKGEDFGRLPNNATHTAPELQDGFIPHWTGKAWKQVENNVGKEGYVNGEPFTIKDYGALPDGWSDTAPEPTEEEKYFEEKKAIEDKYANGDIATFKNLIVNTLCENQPDNEKLDAIRSDYQEILSKMKQEIEDLSNKYGITEEVS